MARSPGVRLVPHPRPSVPSGRSTQPTNPMPWVWLLPATAGGGTTVSPCTSATVTWTMPWAHSGWGGAFCAHSAAPLHDHNVQRKEGLLRG